MSRENFSGTWSVRTPKVQVTYRILYKAHSPDSKYGLTDQDHQALLDAGWEIVHNRCYIRKGLEMSEAKKEIEKALGRNLEEDTTKWWSDVSSVLCAEDPESDDALWNYVPHEILDRSSCQHGKIPRVCIYCRDQT